MIVRLHENDGVRLDYTTTPLADAASRLFLVTPRTLFDLPFTLELQET